MRLILALPLLLLLVLFALSNRQNVDLGLWPTNFALQAPLSLTILLAMGLAFLLGGLLVWLGSFGLRRRARRAEAALHLLESEVEQLRARSPAPPPPVS